MKIKQMVSGVVVMCAICGAMVGCSNQSSSDNSTIVTSNSTQQNNTGDLEKREDINKVLVDNDVVKITVLDKYSSKEDEGFAKAGYTFLVENKSDKDISVSTDSVCVNNELNDPYWGNTIPAGTHSTEYVEWYWADGSNGYDKTDNQTIQTIDDLQNVKGKIMVLDANTWDDLGSVEFSIK